MWPLHRLGEYFGELFLCRPRRQSSSLDRFEDTRVVLMTFSAIYCDYQDDITAIGKV